MAKRGKERKRKREMCELILVRAGTQKKKRAIRPGRSATRSTVARVAGYVQEEGDYWQATSAHYCL